MGYDLGHAVTGSPSPFTLPGDFSELTANSEDPGLFVSAEGHGHFRGMGFCPPLHWFETFIGRCSNLTVIDQAAIDHWSAADPEAEARNEPDPT
jgi:hypothetical protein